MGVYEINQLSGVLFLIAYFAIWFLMLVLWPRTILHRLALALIFTMWLVAARWTLATYMPDLLGARQSYAAATVNVLATLAGVAFAVTAWTLHIRDGMRGE